MISCLLLASSLIAAESLTVRAVLVRPEEVLDQRFEEMLRRFQVNQIIVLVDDDNKAASTAAAKRASELKQPFFVWIEVARNKTLADEHPEWLASIGMHDDWRMRFPNTHRAGKDQVVKAYPWVPIWYKPAFDSHLARLQVLLRDNTDAAGIYLNDLQAGPASCGCGNDQCRWAIDYKVPATTDALTDFRTPAQFLERVRKLTPGKPVVPVWCIECEREDQSDSKPTTGRCGSVPCFRGLCWKEFARQFTPIVESSEHVAIPAFGAEWNRVMPFQRDLPWIRPVIDAALEQPMKFDGETAQRDQIIVVIEAWNMSKERIDAQLRIVQSLGVHGCIIALTKVDQSWEPRLIDVPNERRAPR